MKKSLRRLTALLLCVLMVAVLAGCVMPTTENNANSSDNGSSESTEVDDSIYQEGENKGKYKEFTVKDDDKFEGKTQKTESSKGVFDYVYIGIGKTLSFINSIVPSYIFALLIFAVLVKILLFGFAWKQQKSMVKQAYFKPKERAIRNKYKGRTDQVTMQKMQQEIMEAQQKEGVSMFGGCLPMLIQLPIIMILYNVIRNPLSYISGYSQGMLDSIRNVIGYNVIENVSGNAQKINQLDLVRILRDNAEKFEDVLGKPAEQIREGLPNFHIVGNWGDLSITPSFSLRGWELLYLLIPVITFVALFLTMKLNKKLTAGASIASEEAVGAGMSMKIMDFAMPALSTWFTFMFPAVLGVYWIINNLLGTVQQLILKKMLPFPVFTEEDYKKAEREYNKGRGSSNQGGGNAPAGRYTPKPGTRSLFHMDDEDYDEVMNEFANKENGESADQKNSAGSGEEKKGIFGKAALKKGEKAADTEKKAENSGKPEETENNQESKTDK